MPRSQSGGWIIARIYNIYKPLHNKCLHQCKSWICNIQVGHLGCKTEVCILMNEYSPLSISAVWLFHQLPLMGFGPFERVGVCNGGCNQCTNILSTGDESRSKHHCLLERSLSINLFVYCLFSCCVPPLSTDIESCGSRKKKKQHTRLHFNRGTSSSFLDLK